MQFVQTLLWPNPGSSPRELVERFRAMMSNVKESKDFLEAKLAGSKPEIAVVVGSGLGGITKEIAEPIAIPYVEIPHFPKPTVVGHAGQMIFGELGGKRLMVLSGRFH